MSSQKNIWMLDKWYAQSVAGNTGYVGERKLYSWGSNGQGFLGLNDVVNRSSPTQIGSATDWRKIGYKGASNEYTLCLRTDYEPGSGTCYGWGQNNKGQLGLSNTVYRSSPTQTYYGSEWKWNEVATGNEISIGVLTNGKLYTWGNNNYGQLGLNQSTPTTKDDPDSGSNLGMGWAVGTHKIAAGGYNCLAIKTDNTLWAWGSNLYGALGLSESTPGNDKSSPVQIPGFWNSIHGCAQCFGVVKTDGTLWTWGNNANGNLGHNNKTQYSSPKQLPGTEWQRAAFGPATGAFLKTTGELRMCGANNDGQLGQNSTTQYSSPRQVSGTWTAIMDGQYSHMAAIKSAGSLWTWGGGGEGRLGHNNQTNYSSPKQIPGTYIDIQGGNSFMIAISES